MLCTGTLAHQSVVDDRALNVQKISAVQAHEMHNNETISMHSCIPVHEVLSADRTQDSYGSVYKRLAADLHDMD